MKFTREKLFSVKSGEYIEPCINIYSDEQEKVSKLKRAKKTKATEPKVKKLNDEYSRQYFRLLLNGNFGEKDYQMWLSYDDETRPIDRAAAIKDRQNFINRLKNLYKKLGVEFRWLAITETGVKSGKLHHHIVLPGGYNVFKNGISRNLIEEKWGKGIANCRRLQKRSDRWLNDFATYLMKSQSNAEKGERCWSGSRNLVKPDVRICDNDRINRRRLRELVEARNNDDVQRAAEKIYKGYRLIDWRVEFNLVTGLPFAKLIMVKKE